MKASKIPEELKEFLWKHGLEGRRIYIPKLPSPDLITRHLPLVLIKVEESYHESGITFYLGEVLQGPVFPEGLGKTRLHPCIS